jgi:hypothetical protein
MIYEIHQPLQETKMVASVTVEGCRALCTVCGGVAPALPTQCPGQLMTPEQEASILSHESDSRDGSWSRPSTLHPNR